MEGKGGRGEKEERNNNDTEVPIWRGREGGGRRRSVIIMILRYPYGGQGREGGEGGASVSSGWVWCVVMWSATPE